MPCDISKVDLHCEKNNEAHNTHEICTKRLIVRRGQTFVITLHSSSAETLKPDSLEFTVQTGPKPSDDFGTKSVFGISGKSKPKKSKKPWAAKVLGTSATSVTVFILSPADASIGEYTLSVKTNPEMTECHSAGTFVLLFNPWCSKDWVHLANEEERQEYVMKENGLLYRGASDYISDLAWDFGQFENDILDICLKLLDLNPKCLKDAAKDYSARCNPIYVGRVVSAMINSVGDSGVLEGNWSFSYTGGVSPSHWNSSVDILRKWKESGYHAVKYGQCWVFAGVMCTVLRCLGIPCRAVTNFSSAHDTHGNLTIDEYYTVNGFDSKKSVDSIWNYHVWVEGWMRRPDLQGEQFYDGWQVLDPTPQEESDGVYCCGPAPVKAVCEGHTDLKYDLPFVFAEVNADRVKWLIMDDGSEKKEETETKSVGQNISTKSVGSDKRLDITDNYKYPEGTLKEREVFDEAVKRIEKLRHPRDAVDGIAARAAAPPPPPAPAPAPPIVSVKVEELSKPVNGKDIDLVIKLLSPLPRKLTLRTNAQVMEYNNTVESKVFSEEKKVQLQENTELTVPFKLPFDKYGSHLKGNNSIKITAVPIDKEHPDELYVAEKNIVPENPPVNITVIGDPVQSKPLQADIFFDNPLPVALNNCSITISGSGLLRQTVEARQASLGPGMRVLAQVYFTPYKSGAKKLVVDFDCEQLRDIQTSCNLHVKPLPNAATLLQSDEPTV